MNRVTGSKLPRNATQSGNLVRNERMRPEIKVQRHTFKCTDRVDSLEN